MEILTKEFVVDLLNQQREFFQKGNTLPLKFRLEQLKKLKNAILKYQPELENALYLDLGKSKLESYTSEIGFVLGKLTHTLKHLKTWMKPIRTKTPITVFAAKSYIVKQPYGSTLIIGPFNYPFQLLFDPLVAAISAGNCAVLNPSDLTPNTSSVIKKIIQTTFDKNYIFCTDGGIENSTLLLNSRFDKIFFTGSINVGKIVMRTAADNLIPVTLELGGKSPVIVGKSAKLQVSCERIVWGKFMNAGQTCVAPDYVFVHRSIFPQFIEELKSAIVRFYGTDIQNNPDYGRIVNQRHFDRLKNILEQDKEHIVFGGEVDAEDRYIQPTILCPPEINSLACMQEEIFGPILPIFQYDDVDETIAHINANEKPLALYIFSEDKVNIKKVLDNTSSGGVSVNDTVSHIINHYLPFGGVGQSGMGSYHGEYGFLNFSHLRSVLKRSTIIKLKVVFPPFTKEKLDIIKKRMK